MNRHLPAVARHVPVQLVVHPVTGIGAFHATNHIFGVVAEEERAPRILRARHADLQSQLPALSLLPVLEGRTKLKDGAESIFRSTMALVKRKRTYFRRDPRITWIGCSQPFDQMYREAKEAL